MAEDEKNEQSVADAIAGEGTQSKVGKLLQLLVPVGIVVLSAGGGFLITRLVGGPPAPAQAAPDAPAEKPQTPAESKAGEDCTYFDLEPIIVNLNEPRLARHVRATLTLVIRKEDHDVAVKAIETKLPALRSWLILYLSDCSLAEVRGAGNLNRILRDIQDCLNDRLWPNERPMIVRVEYKDWAVQ